MSVFNRQRIKEYLATVDWDLFIFLLLFMNVKLVVKIAGLAFIYFRRFNFSFGFSFRKSRLPLFYPIMIGIAILNLFLLNLVTDAHYLILLLTGVVFWLLCILAVHQVKLTLEKSDIAKIHQAILLFFVINILFSLINISAIMLEIGEINPYRYQGMYQKYFMNTGDNIKGITFDNSSTNAILNAFGVVYFLTRKQWVMSSLCMIVLLLTASNFTNLLILVCLVYMFVFRSGRNQKSIIIFHLVLLAIFVINVSPHNNKYAIGIIEKMFNKSAPVTIPKLVLLPVEQRPDSLLTEDQKKYKIAKRYLDSVASMHTATVKEHQTTTDSILSAKTIVRKDNIHAPDFQHRPDTSDNRLRVIKLLKQLRVDTLEVIKKLDPVKDNGKITAIKQTIRFLERHPSKIMTGAGMGNFSSKLAFRASGLKIAGSYPSKYTYINPDFENNHLSIYLDYFSKDTYLHSVANTPNSVYIQLLSEYGITGLLAFLFFYVLYFARQIRRLSYGIPLMLILMGAFCIDYWYEQLSIVVMFELLVLLDLKDIRKTSNDLI
jgi:hypothetical protein